jgi:hypothetical protein
MAKQKTEQKSDEKKRDGTGALFIPAGLLIGFGIGIAVSNIPAGMFIGLGAGFLAFALYKIFKK